MRKQVFKATHNYLTNYQNKVKLKTAVYRLLFIEDCCFYFSSKKMFRLSKPVSFFSNYICRLTKDIMFHFKQFFTYILKSLWLQQSKCYYTGENQLNFSKLLFLPCCTFILQALLHWMCHVLNCGIFNFQKICLRKTKQTKATSPLFEFMDSLDR